MNRQYGATQEWVGIGYIYDQRREIQGSSGSAGQNYTPETQNPDFYNQGRGLPTQPLYRNPQTGPRIGSAGETTPNYSSVRLVSSNIPYFPLGSLHRNCW